MPDIICPNPNCLRHFRTGQALLSHLQQSKRSCAEYFAQYQFETNPKLVDAPHRKGLPPDAQKPSLPLAEMNELDCGNESMGTSSPSRATLSSEDNSLTGSDSHTTEVTIDNTSIEADIIPGALDEHRDFAAKFNVAFTPSLLAETKLLKILNDANAPHFLYAKIMDWLTLCQSIGLDFEGTTSQRTTTIRRLRQWLHIDDIKPIVVDVTLTYPQREVIVPVTTFDFESMFMSLMNDPTLTLDTNLLDVPPDNPYGPYNGTRLSVANSGEWYRRAYSRLIDNPQKEILAPICFACDETHVSSSGNISCWPLLFSTTLFANKSRNTPGAWRPLGYIYDTSIHESQAQRHASNAKDKATRLHLIFAAILRSYVECQRSGGIKGARLNLGGIARIVDVKVPCIFIIGDMQGGDKICGRSVYYNKDAKRICRKCNVKGEDAGNPDIECKKINMAKVVRLVANNRADILKEFSQTNVHSAWFDVDYGKCRYGVFSAACPVEPLHALENGLISDTLNIFFEILKQKKQGYSARLDVLAQSLAKEDRQRFFSSGSDPQMPRMIWKDGVSSITQMPARQRVGLMLTIVILSQTDEGRILLVPAMADPEDNEDAATKRYYKMVYVFQMLLSYWSWLRQASFWSRGDVRSKQEAKDAIRRMLWELKLLWPRHTGNEWIKAKFHEMLHVPDDIERHGAPMNTHTGPTEHNHIFHVKRPVRNTQKRRDVLDHQIALRMSETHVINTAHDRMTYDYRGRNHAFREVKQDHISGISSNGSKRVYSIRIDGSRNIIEVPAQAPVWMSKPVCQQIADGLHGQAPADALRFTLYSEYRRCGELFRAHPSYRRGLPWYDWVMLRWERPPSDRRRYNRSRYPSGVHYGDDEETAKLHNYAPARILGFLSGGESETGETLMVVQSCSFFYKRQTVFTTEWKLEAPLHLEAGVHVVDVNAIVRPCLMIPKTKEEGVYQEVWIPDRWASEFLNVEFWSGGAREIERL